MFTIICNGVHVVGDCSIDDLEEKLAHYRALYDRVQIAEIIIDATKQGTISTGLATKKIPAELDRAVDAWNRLADRLPVKLAKVRKAAQFLAAYRRWKRENPARTYVLERLIDDVEAQGWCHGWITFGWLFGKKNGEHNSEKLRNRQYEGARRNDTRKPDPTGQHDDDFNLPDA